MNGREWVCTFEEYLAEDAVSSGPLNDFLASPPLYEAKHVSKTIENEQTPAMLLGSAIHCYVLEGPEVFNERFAVGPVDDRRAKAWKDWAPNQNAEHLITPSQYMTVLACRQAIHLHPEASRLLLQWPGIAELSGLWNDDETGLACKLRFDRRLPEHNTIVELKTSRSALPDAVQRSAFSFGYHRRAAWYIEGYRQMYGEMPRAMVFVTVATEPPHEVIAWTFDAAAEQQGAIDCVRALRGIAAARAEGLYRAPWMTDVQTVSLPRWAASAAEPESP